MEISAQHNSIALFTEQQVHDRKIHPGFQTMSITSAFKHLKLTETILKKKV